MSLDESSLRVPFKLADPVDREDCFLNAVSRAAEGATGGFGVFAFASSRGVETFAQDERIANFLENRPFEIVVGTDAVTDLRALRSLIGIQKSHPQVLCSAFLHKKSDAIFHPKFAFFDRIDSGLLLIGSANLTEPALLRNWEAFLVQSLSKAQREAIIDWWVQWKEQNSHYLLGLDDKRVQRRARKNVFFRRANPEVAAERALKARRKKQRAVMDAEVLGADVWVGQISPNERWKQADVGKTAFTQFLGLNPNVKGHEIWMEAVLSDGTVYERKLHEPMKKPGSSNYYLKELALARGKQRPSTPPILVLLRTKPNFYRYRLVMPGDPSYDPLINLMDKYPAKTRRKHKESHITRKDLNDELPEFEI